MIPYIVVLIVSVCYMKRCTSFFIRVIFFDALQNKKEKYALFFVFPDLVYPYGFIHIKSFVFKV